MPTSEVTDVSPHDVSPDERDERLDAELAGLDALELANAGRRPLPRRIWSATWPKLAAIVMALAIWEAVVASGWRPEFVLPPPDVVWDALREQAASGTLWTAIGVTLRRAAVGFSMALVIGVVVGAVVSQVRVVRVAFGSFITGLQTMPSIAWFPLAVLLFKRTDAAIYFVVVLGASPSIANGLISGIDTLPPLYVRAGRTMGARGVTLLRHVVLPGALPSFMAGIKQGWAFAWRSLMAGELLVIISNSRSIGERLDHSRTLSDAPTLIAYMIVILFIGIVLDALVFGAAERAIQRRWGLRART
jgi:NitT/TauT family transport system permease protein